ncbi:MAG: SDR family oxidoreductase [Firmicutes bacterium]|jgi:3-oxoacyl-[acyl-carrier protein] reductase|nr:SDR family oxidoreductase [Bacillota bacterium]
MALLNNKIALVTSSTRGIGYYTAKKLASEGAKVYLAVRRLDAGKKVAEEIKKIGGNANVVYFNAEEEQTYTSMIQEVYNKENRIDILVNNFGTTDVKQDLDILNGSTDKFFEIINNNLKSVYLPCKSIIPIMEKNNSGSIINISSVGGKFPDISRTAYGISKAAINFLTKDIAVQYAHKNIRCNAIMPGLIATDASMNSMSEEFLNMFLKTVPLGKAGQPDDVANAVLYFASDLSAFVTGEILSVSGGFGVPSPMYALYKDMMKNG